MDIVEFISSTGVNLSIKGKLYRATCPFHRDAIGQFEKTPSLFVYPDTQSWYCFGCSSGGDIISYCILFYSCSYNEALEILDCKKDLYTVNNLRNKLNKVLYMNDNFIYYWTYANKLLYTKKLMMSNYSKEIDQILYTSQENQLSAIKKLINILNKL